MDPLGDSPDASGGTDPLERAGLRLMDLLHRDLGGEVADVVAGRYRLGERLGQGAQGTVHRALDELTHQTVAVKLLPPLFETHLVQLRSEIAALRLLRLPGVVHMFDEGVHHGRPFLVMELVDGEPFPGALPEGATRWTWGLLRDRALALLDVLARVHAAGLVHRDLKPRNVLVTAAGRPVLLDFGLTVGRALADDSASSSHALGTPAYAAPEQVRGEAVDARADLYAFGVMIWEALAGRRPHAGERVSGILRLRLDEPAEKLAQVAPGVPSDVARVVDELLERTRDRRPRSAADVAEGLRGESVRDGPVRLAFVGREEPLVRLLRAAEARLPACIVGPPGSGITRLLQEAAARAQARGQRVIWLPASCRPFDGLGPLSSWLDQAEPRDLQEAREASARAVHAALAQGVVLVSDGLEDLDQWSRAILEKEGRQGAVWVATTGVPPSWMRGDTLYVGPLAEVELRDLFEGNDLLQHVHEDAARELWGRTEGLPRSVEAELEGWYRAGLVEPAGNRWHIARAAVDRLRGGLNVLPAAARQDATDSPLGEDLDELLAWIHLAWPNTSRPQLVELSAREPWLLDAEIESLVAGRAVRVLPDGRFRPLRAARCLANSDWLARARERAHATLGTRLLPGTPGRLYHLVAAGAHELAAREALMVAADCYRAGRMGDAEVALAEGLRAARCCTAATAQELEQAILREWLPVALAEITPIAADRLLYELGRSAGVGRSLAPIERLVRAAIAAYETDGRRAMRVVSALAEFGDPHMDRWRHALRVKASRRCALEIEVEAVEQACAWARMSDQPDAAASVLEWEGRLRYRQGRFAEAAALLVTAANRASTITQQLSAMLNAAAALLEVPALDDSEELARRARDLAATSRLSLFEGRAECLARAAIYRRGDDRPPDLALVAALERVGALVQAAAAALTEASFAWRRGELVVASDLATTAVRLTSGSAKRDFFLMGRAIQCAAAGRSPPPGEAELLMQEACTGLLASVGVQVVALLARSGAAVPAAAAALRAAAQRELAGRDPAQRLDVLALSECTF